MKSHPKRGNPAISQEKREQVVKNQPVKSDESPELLKILAGIKEELHLLNKNFSRVIEPEVLLDHYRKGAALRVDDSSSRLRNPTL